MSADKVSSMKYNETIAEGEAMLKRIEAKARRVRGAIEDLREMRDAGEPWTASPLESATQN